MKVCGISTTPSLTLCRSVSWRFRSRLVYQEYRALFCLRAMIHPNRGKPPVFLIFPNYVLQRLNSWQIRAARLECPFSTWLPLREQTTWVRLPGQLVPWWPSPQFVHKRFHSRICTLRRPGAVVSHPTLAIKQGCYSKRNWSPSPLPGPDL